MVMKTGLPGEIVDISISTDFAYGVTSIFPFPLILAMVVTSMVPFPLILQ